MSSDGGASDIVMLREMFPRLPHSAVVSAFQQAKGEVLDAIDILTVAQKVVDDHSKTVSHIPARNKNEVENPWPPASQNGQNNGQFLASVPSVSYKPLPAEARSHLHSSGRSENPSSSSSSKNREDSLALKRKTYKAFVEFEKSVGIYGMTVAERKKYAAQHPGLKMRTKRTLVGLGLQGLKYEQIMDYFKEVKEEEIANSRYSQSGSSSSSRGHANGTGGGGRANGRVPVNHAASAAKRHSQTGRQQQQPHNQRKEKIENPSMNPNPHIRRSIDGSLSKADLQAFEENGFCVFKSVIPQGLINQALTHINFSIGQRKSNNRIWCVELYPSDVLKPLFLETQALHIAKQLTKNRIAIESVNSLEVALSFPGSECDPVQLEVVGNVLTPLANWTSKWHIESIKYKPEKPGSMISEAKELDTTPIVTHVHSILVYVFLSDCTADYQGNLCVLEKSHTLAKGFAKWSTSVDSSTSKKQFKPFKQNMSRTCGLKQLHVSAGDVVMCDSFLGKAFAPNISPNVRYAVVFRLPALKR